MSTNGCFSLFLSLSLSLFILPSLHHMFVGYSCKILAMHSWSAMHAVQCLSWGDGHWRGQGWLTKPENHDPKIVETTMQKVRTINSRLGWLKQPWQGLRHLTCMGWVAKRPGVAETTMQKLRVLNSRFEAKYRRWPYKKGQGWLKQPYVEILGNWQPWGGFQ